MKFSIIKSINSSDIEGKLPKRFKGLVPPLSQQNEIFTLILFGGNEVIRSRTAQAVLRKLGNDSETNLAAFGYNFTQEAKEILQELGAKIYVERDYYWTDDSYNHIKGYRAERKL